jgi:hypothetical protein
MSTLEYILDIATPEDAIAIEDVETASHRGRSSNPIDPLLWPAELKNAPAIETSPSAPIHDMDKYDSPGSFQRSRMADPNATYVKVTQGDEVVAFALFMIVPGRTPEQWTERFGPNRPLPRKVNVPLYQATTGARLLIRQRVIGSQTYFCKWHSIFCAYKINKADTRLEQRCRNYLLNQSINVKV